MRAITVREEMFEKESTPAVSIVTGTLNEMGNVGRFISSLYRELAGNTSFQVVVVDDGSTDGTASYLSGIAARDRRIKVILNGERRGLLNSNLQGIRAADGKYCIVMDSDLQHPVDRVRDIVRQLDSGADIVVCSRYIQGGSVGNRSPMRGLISRVAVFLTKAAIPGTRRSTDPISGFFGFKKGLLIPEAMPSFSYKTLTLILAMNRKTSLKEIPFRFQKRGAGDSKIVDGFGFVFNFIIELIGLRKRCLGMRTARIKYPYQSGGLETTGERSSH